MPNRRDFLKMLGVTPIFYGLPNLFDPTKKTGSRLNPKLILIELKGGNDGLNTVIPSKQDKYYKLRPTLAIKKYEQINLTSDIAIHPALVKLISHWDQGELACLLGLGYENPNLSHFKSIQIWDTATRDANDDLTKQIDLLGWIPKVVPDAPLKGIAFNSSLGPLYTQDLTAISLVDPDQFAKLGRAIGTSNFNPTNDALAYVLKVQESVHELAKIFYDKMQKIPKPPFDFPKNGLGKSLESVFKLMVANINSPTYKVSLGGFDTHTNQLNAQSNNLTILADCLNIFCANLKVMGLWNETLILTYSEFGRRVQENASGGTDHGTAAPHLALGGLVKGGIYGSYPSLENLDTRGNLIYTADFRDIYSIIAAKLWGKSMPVLNKDLDFII